MTIHFGIGSPHRVELNVAAATARFHALPQPPDNLCLVKRIMTWRVIPYALTSVRKRKEADKGSVRYLENMTLIWGKFLRKESLGAE